MGQVIKQSDYATDEEWYAAADRAADSGRMPVLWGDNTERTAETAQVRGCFSEVAIGLGLTALGLGVAACGIEGTMHRGFQDSHILKLHSASSPVDTDDFPQLFFPNDEGVSYTSYLSRS